MTSPTPITSLTNARVKAAVRLRDRGERAATGLTLVDGGREILRALDAGVFVAEAFVAPDLLRTPAALEAADRLRAAAAVIEATPAVLAKVAFGDRSDGVVAVVRTPARGLDDLDLPANPLLIVVEGVEKPGNLGAVLRSADGAGADGVIVADPLTDPFNPNAIRASLGTVFTIPIATATSGAARDWLISRGVRPVAAIVGAATPYTDADLTRPVAIVLGSEAEGLTDTWRRDAVQPVAIPMLGAADSLNVAIAAAVLLYEAVRQRRATWNPAH